MTIILVSVKFNNRMFCVSNFKAFDASSTCKSFVLFTFQSHMLMLRFCDFQNNL